MSIDPAHNATLTDRITPVILAGGSGNRLWPLSTDEHPKQFQAIAGKRSMFQQALLRFTDTKRFTPPIIVGNFAHGKMIIDELSACGIVPANVVLEPVARNTAPAITLAAMVVMTRNLNEKILVVPSDHFIKQPEQLIANIEQACAAVDAGNFATFGIIPKGPENCYGYIKQGSNLSDGVFHVEKFVEKPSRKQAEKMLSEGGYLWNSGVFLLPVKPLLQALSQAKPDIINACQQALTNAQNEEFLVVPDMEALAGAEDISLDHALMENTKHACVVPCDLSWSDVGSWTAVWDLAERDDMDNVIMGNAMVHNAKSAYVRSEGPMTAVVGLRDIIVVNTGDAVIVTSKAHAQDVQKIALRVRDKKVTDAVAQVENIEIAKSVETAMVDDNNADQLEPLQKTVND